MSSNYEKTEISHFTEAIAEILCFPMMLQGSQGFCFVFKGQRARDPAKRDREPSSPPSACKVNWLRTQKVKTGRVKKKSTLD